MNLLNPRRALALPPHAAFPAVVALAAFVFGLILVKPAAAQSSDTFSQTLDEFGKEYARLYAQPVIDAVGANLNSGFFYEAGVDESGLIPGVNLYVGVKAFGSLVPSSDRSFSLDYSAQEVISINDAENTICTSAGDVTYEIDDAPTAFGSDDPGEVMANGGQPITFQCTDGTTVQEEVSLDLLPGFLEGAGIAPLAVPQVGVGVPFTGTHVSLRFIPDVRYKDYGSIEFVGGGVRQDVGRFLPMIPFDLSAHLFYQTISLKEEALSQDETEFVSASAFAGGVSASKSISVLTFYGGLQLESMSANLDYTIPSIGDQDPQRIQIDFSGANSFRVLAGASLGLGPVVLNLDVSQGQRTVFSTGLGLHF